MALHSRPAFMDYKQPETIAMERKASILTGMPPINVRSGHARP